MIEIDFFGLVVILILAAFCLGVVFLVFVFLMIGAPSIKYLRGDSEEFFSDAFTKLKSWNIDAFTDFSAYVEGSYIAFFKFHARGLLKSLRDPEAGRWIVFEIKSQLGRGMLEMRTSKKIYRMQFTAISRPSTAKLEVNREHVGTMERSGNTVTLFKADGSTLGIYHRYDPADAKFTLRRKHRPPYGSVELKHRSKFKLCRSVFPQKNIPPALEERRAMFQELTWKPNEEEEDWLMGLAGWEILNAFPNFQSRYFD